MFEVTVQCTVQCYTISLEMYMYLIVVKKDKDVSFIMKERIEHN